MKWILLVVIAVLAAAGFYYHAHDPQTVLRNKAEQAFSDASKAVATKDLTQVSQVLQKYLSDTAQVHLEIRFFTLTQAYDGKPMVQDFDKPTFIKFINDTLYSLQEYSYEPAITQIKAAPDFKSATLNFTSKEFAEGNSYYAGTAVGMQFSSDTECEGEMVVPAGSPLLNKVSCIMHLRTAPKPEEAYKLENPEALRQLLR